MVKDNRKRCLTKTVVRLLSLTHSVRQKEMAERTATSRISFTISKYGVLQSPSYVSVYVCSVHVYQNLFQKVAQHFYNLNRIVSCTVPTRTLLTMYMYMYT